MSAIVTVLHVLVCIFMIAVILLQRGKGAEIGAVFGGAGSATMFGSRGAGNFITKLTTASAVIFMLTSLSLSYMRAGGSEDRLFEGAPEEEVVAESGFEEVSPTPDTAPEDAFEEVPQPAEDAPSP